MSTAALGLAFAVSHQAADGVLIALLPAAGLESIFGYCLRRALFARVGIRAELATPKQAANGVTPILRFAGVSPPTSRPVISGRTDGRR